MTPEAIPKLCAARLPRQSVGDVLMTSLAAGVDRGLMRAVSLVVERQVLPRDGELAQLRASIQAMLDSGLLDHPARFFRFVSRLEGAGACGKVTSRGVLRGDPAGGTIRRRVLASHYRPHRLVADTAHAGSPAGIVFEHWEHPPGRERGTVIALHGFAMGWPVIDGFALCARQWFGQGMNVVLLTLPDHGARRAPDRLFSGQAYTVPDALALAGAVHRAVYEIFELKNWLRARGDSPVGLFGMSLGGYLASLCGALSADFDFLLPMVPPVCMGDLAWRVFRDTGHCRAGGDPVLTERNLRAAFYVHSPLAHPRRVARERVLIVAGAGDRIVPPEHPSALWEHWERPAIHWLRGSHVAPVASARLMPVLARHLGSLGIL